MTPEEQYKQAILIRNFEIDMFWKRSLFFWGFITAALLAYGAVRKDSSDLAILICCLGTVSSLAWTLQNRGSKYWYEAWEEKVSRLERGLNVELFTKTEVAKDKGPLLSARRYSVSKLAIALSDYIFLLWLFLLLGKLIAKFSPDCIECLRKSGLAAFCIFSVLYLGYIFFETISRDEE